MRRAMLAKLPAKIDIGPVYNVDPQRRKAYTGASLRCCTLLWLVLGMSFLAPALYACCPVCIPACMRCHPRHN